MVGTKKNQRTEPKNIHLQTHNLETRDGVPLEQFLKKLSGDNSFQINTPLTKWLEDPKSMSMTN